ncbi:MAG: endonuclease, partial [Prevotellaceae bacterium]|nr:endonuclease [Prevotellaceae bacterium]
MGTYNIRNNSDNGDVENGNGWNQRVGVICGQINFEQPDAFGTQEVLHQQVLDLKAGLPGYDYIGVGRDDGKEDGEYECIWYNTNRLQLLDNGNFWLNETPDRPAL